MCHHRYTTEEEPLRERIEEAEPEFGSEPEEELTAEEEPEREEKPAVPTPSDD